MEGEGNIHYINCIITNDIIIKRSMTSLQRCMRCEDAWRCCINVTPFGRYSAARCCAVRCPTGRCLDVRCCACGCLAVGCRTGGCCAVRCLAVGCLARALLDPSPQVPQGIRWKDRWCPSKRHGMCSGCIVCLFDAQQRNESEGRVDRETGRTPR